MIIDAGAVAARPHDRLVERLIDAGISVAQIDRARRLGEQSGTPLVAAITRLGLVDEDSLVRYLAEALDLPVALREALLAAPSPPDDVNHRFLRARRAVVVGETASEIQLAMADPLDDDAAEALAFAYGRPVARLVARDADIEDALAQLSANAADARADSELEGLTASLEQEKEEVGRLQDLSSDAPVIRFVNRLLGNAVARRASDVHIEPQPRALVVRHRIDGQLHEVERLSERWAGPVASRVKVMAKLDIAEKRLPQDGRIRFSHQGREIDVRVATAPTLHGESLVLRLLGRTEMSYDLDGLEMSVQALEHLKQALDRPHGMVLLTGPTGSGKTTTLYAALNRVRGPGVKILTVEDPVEYVVAGINQVQVKPEIGLTYAAALRAFLRHDPNILMVGEIRDEETADIAAHFALVGRLVLSTLHTNSAVGAITRLLEMGVEPFVLASTLRLSVAQRLVRKLCRDCAQPRAASSAETALLAELLGAGQAPKIIHDAVGCATCEGSGYRGRTLIVETVPMTPRLQALIRERASDAEIERAAAAEGVVPLLTHGLQLVAEGTTSLDEVMRAADARVEEPA